MFHGNRWASVFVNCLAENTEAGLVCLKALVESLSLVSKTLFGFSAARKLEKTLRESVVAAADSDPAESRLALEYSIRFICLLVEKKYFKHIDVVLRNIEESIDAQKGVLAVTVESASPFDNNFEENLKQQIMERTAAAGIKMKVVLNPDLLGGYRLRIGSLLIDASLKGQIEKMKIALAGGMFS
jgi:F-type H+-transporting ATPase subunit delta